MNKSDLEDTTASGADGGSGLAARCRPRYAAAPGITGPNLQPDGARRLTSASPTAAMVYSWGYGCNGTPTGFARRAAIAGRELPHACRFPGPTLIVTRGQTGHGDADQ